MSTARDHKRKAAHNQNFLEAIDKKLFPDWFVAVAFYKAVHLVEALFASQDTKHSGNHRERHDLLKTKYPTIWKDYLPLYSQSRRARYRTRPISDETVEYVSRRLRNVESGIEEIAI